MFKAIASFIFAHLFLFGFNTKVYVAPVPLPNSTTTPITLATSTKPVATSSPIQKSTTTPKAKATTTKPVASTKTQATSTAPTIPEPTPDFERINTFTRTTLINILCTTKGGELSPISGTGVLVGSNGLILTNAHIGQYFLLKNFNQKDFLTCVARTGSPAYPRYNLELVYISPTWVSENKDQLKKENPTGTGENDFAFLRITSMIDGSKLPETFPFLSMDIRESIGVGEPALLASYPAGFLGGLSIIQDLSVTSAIATISEIFTFKDGTIDLISVPGTVVSQKGSSGGAVVDKYATLLGIISTSSDGNSTKDRDLRAITLAYINRSLQKELGLSLEQFTDQDMDAYAKKFQISDAPALTKLITDELTKTN